MTFFERLSGRRGSGWAAFLLLAPLAYLGGALLMMRYDTRAQSGIAISRAEAIEAARAVAAREGVDTRDWKAYFVFQGQREWRHYIATRGGDDAARLRALAPEARGRVLLRSNTDGAAFEVQLTPRGHVLGFQQRLSESARAVPIDDKAALALAQKAFATQAGTTANAFQLADSRVRREEAITRRTWVWRRAVPGHGDVSQEVTVSLQDARVVRRLSTIAVSPSYTKTVISQSETFEATKGLSLAALILGLFVYCVTRLVTRAREKEVPWRRTILIGVAVGGGIALAMLLSDMTMFQDGAPQDDGGVSTQSATGVMLGALMAGLMMGAGVGIAWGACEGDVRELFSEKLRSFDAVLGGRWTSRPVWQSVVNGLAFSGYAILATGLLQWLASQHAGHYEAIESDQGAIFASRLPALMAGTSFVTGVSILMVGILLPVSVLRRRLPRHLLPAAALLLVAAFTAVASAGNHQPFYTGVLLALITGATVVLPFWKGDLVTAIATTFGSSAMIWVTQLSAQPTPALQTASMQIGSIFLLVAAAAIVGALRGGDLALDGHHPEYARNITERMALHSEISAAREAQLGVMPRAVPRVPGLDIAAECRPARGLSGDYYDFFTRADGRLDVVMAAGEHLPLTSALAVTLAKGMLLGYSRRGVDPAGALEHLRRHLGSIFGEQLPFSILLVSLDTEGSAIEFAALGTSVGLLLRSGDGPPVWLRDAHTDVPGNGVVERGRATVAAGDRLLMVTRGIVAANDDASRPFGGAAIASVLSEVSGASAIVEETLRRVALHAGDAGHEEDWTALAMVLRDPSPASPQEPRA
jgi:hypothetical protein